jgi:hypothetical protein
MGLLSRFQASRWPNSKAFTRTVKQTVHEISLKTTALRLEARRAALLPTTCKEAQDNPRGNPTPILVFTASASICDRSRRLCVSSAPAIARFYPVFLDNLFRAPA